MAPRNSLESEGMSIHTPHERSRGLDMFGARIMLTCAYYIRSTDGTAAGLPFILYSYADDGSLNIDGVSNCWLGGAFSFFLST